MVKSGKSGGSGSGGSRSLAGKITDAILKKSNKTGKGADSPGRHHPQVKPGTKIEGWPQGKGAGRKKS